MQISGRIHTPLNYPTSLDSDGRSDQFLVPTEHYSHLPCKSWVSNISIRITNSTRIQHDMENSMGDCWNNSHSIAAQIPVRHTLT